MVSEGRRRFVAPLLIAVAIALGVAGQRSFAETKPLLLDGIVLYLTAIAALVAAVSILGAEPGPLRPPLPPRARLTLSAALRRLPSATLRRWPLLLGLATAVVTVLVALAQLRLGNRDSYLAPFLLWVTALASYLSAVALSVRRPGATPATDGLEEPPRLPRYVWLVPLALAALAFALRFYRVADIPPTLGGDEANQGLDGVKVLTGEIRNPFGLGWLGVPAMAGYWIAAAISVFGRNMFALRLPAVVVGTATVVISYYLVRRLQNPTTAWLTAALLASYGFHVHFSRLGAVTQVLDGFFVSLSLLFLVRAVQDGRRLDWALSGAVAGLAQYSYAGARLTPLLLLVLAVAHLVLGGREGFRRHGIGVLVLFGAFLVVAAPMIQLALRDPDNYNARLNSVGILQNGWLEREVVIRGDSRAEVLLDQFQRAALGFNLYRDRTAWYGLREPLMGFLPSIFFLLGVGYCTWRLFDLRLLPMTAWWWGAVLTGGMLTVDPPSSMRLVTLTVPSCFFAALALERCSSVLSRELRLPARATVAALIAIATVIGVQNVRSYFVEYTPLLIYGNPTAVTATALGKYARDELGEDWTLVLFGAPHLIAGFATLPFLAPEVEGVDIIEPLRGPPPRDFVPSGKNLAFAFLPNRRAELDLVRASFPGGEVIEGPAPWPDGLPIYVLYNVRRDATGAASGL